MTQPFLSQGAADAEPLLPAHNNNFNLLRFVLASLVLISHCTEIKVGNRSNEPLSHIFGTMSFGEVAVDSFFILSGYLLLMSWTVKPKYQQYIKNRILRIFPGFLCCSFLCAFVFGAFGGDHEYFKELNLFKWGVSALTLSQPHIPPVFTGTFYPNINSSLWTIPYEFSCYFIIPACAALARLSKTTMRRLFTGIWFVIFITYLITRHFRSEYSWAESSFSSFRFSLFFVTGGILFIYQNAIPKSARFHILLSLAILACMFSTKTAEIGIVFFWGILLLAFANRPSGKLNWFNSLPDTSYGLYLYAWPITKVLLFLNPDLNQPLLILATWLFATGFGAMSWYIVEKPFLALKRLTKKAPQYYNDLPEKRA